jgi:hypothetical protein
MTGEALMAVLTERGPQTVPQLVAVTGASTAEVRVAVASLIFDEHRATCQMGVWPDGRREPVVVADPPSDVFFAAGA